MEESNKNTVFLSLGSNLGDRKINIENAKEFICDQIGDINESSSIYESEAWGLKDQKDFLNSIVMVSTELDPLSVLEECLIIESVMGRERIVKWGPRNIDIDIIYYNNQIINNIDLVVPHPRMHDRRFVLIPLMELASQLKHPIFGTSTQQLLKNCNDSSKVTLYV